MCIDGCHVLDHLYTHDETKKSSVMFLCTKGVNPMKLDLLQLRDNVSVGLGSVFLELQQS